MKTYTKLNIPALSSQYPSAGLYTRTVKYKGKHIK